MMYYFEKKNIMCFLLFSIFLILPTWLVGQVPNIPKVPSVPGSPLMNNNNTNNMQQRQIPQNWQNSRSFGRGTRTRNNSNTKNDSKDTKKEEKKLTFDEQYEKANATTPIVINHDQYQSSDKVCMTGFFYKGEAKEETVPVILLHGANGSKKDMVSLATKLAESGMAVLVPDLRGHGDSIRRTTRDFGYGRSVGRSDDSYTVDKFTSSDYQAMIQYDGRFWYSFLISEHNKKHLNIRKLFVVGSDLGAAVACGWVQNDWAVSGSKNGHYAKGLILVSPVYKQCATFAEGIKKEQRSGELGFLGIVGNLSEEHLEGMKEIQEMLGGKQAADTPLEKKRFPVISLKTQSQGKELVATPSFGVATSIKKYIDMRAERSTMKSLKWQEID